MKKRGNRNRREGEWQSPFWNAVVPIPLSFISQALPQALVGIIPVIPTPGIVAPGGVIISEIDITLDIDILTSTGGQTVRFGFGLYKAELPLPAAVPNPALAVGANFDKWLDLKQTNLFIPAAASIAQTVRVYSLKRRGRLMVRGGDQLTLVIGTAVANATVNAFLSCRMKYHNEL